MVPYVWTSASAGTLQPPGRAAGPHVRDQGERARVRGGRRVQGDRRGRGGHAARPTTTPDFYPAVHRLRQPARVGTAHPQLQRRRAGSTSTARPPTPGATTSRSTAPRTTPTGSSSTATRWRCRTSSTTAVSAGLRDAAPGAADHVLAADHARRRRHPPAGHAVRLEQDGRVAHRRQRRSTTCRQLENLGLQARRDAHAARAQRRASPPPCRPASSTSSTSEARMNPTRLDLRRAGLAAAARPVGGRLRPGPHHARAGAGQPRRARRRRGHLADDRAHQRRPDSGAAAGRRRLGRVPRRAGAGRRRPARSSPTRSATPIEYWGSGGVTRWNEILRELVARFNLPPAPRRGRHRIRCRTRTNPFSDPQFPFANPPYAARAYSYVSVGAYEALKAAWHYKYLYRRPAPSRVDSTINALVPAGRPSRVPVRGRGALGRDGGDAARALPGRGRGDRRARRPSSATAAMWSGRAAPSDIAAGQALGRAVAAVMMARAATDGMRTAGGSPRHVAGAGRPRGRAGRDPLAQPGEPGAAAHAAALRTGPRLDDDADRHRERASAGAALHVLGADAAGAGRGAERGGPPDARAARDRPLLGGRRRHLHAARATGTTIAADSLRGAGFSEVRTARTFALVNMAMHDAAVGCWEAKYFYFNPRPSQLDPGLKTATGLPNFPGLHLGTLDILGGRGHRALLPVPGRGPPSSTR